jgi:hypothetical protein
MRAFVGLLTLGILGCGDPSGPFRSAEGLGEVVGRLADARLHDRTSLGATVLSDHLGTALLNLTDIGTLRFDFGSRGSYTLAAVAVVFPTDLDMVDYRFRGSVAAVLALDPDDPNGPVMSAGVYGWGATDVLPRRTTVLSVADGTANSSAPWDPDLSEGSGWVFLNLDGVFPPLEAGFGGHIVLDLPDVGNAAPCRHPANTITNCLARTGTIDVDLDFTAGGFDGNVKKPEIDVAASGTIPVVVVDLSGAGGETDPATPVVEIEILQEYLFSPVRLTPNSGQALAWVLRTRSGARLLGVRPEVHIGDPTVATVQPVTGSNIELLGIWGVNPGTTRVTLEANGATTSFEVVVSP